MKAKDIRLEKYKRIDVRFEEFRNQVKVCPSMIDFTPVLEKEAEEVIEL